MKKHISKLKAFVVLFVAALPVLGSFLAPALNASALDNDSYGFTMSPLKESIILNPGESYQSSFIIHNPATHTKDFEYVLSVTPFFVDENYNNIFTEVDNFSEMASWITIDSPLSGVLQPNQDEEIYFTINVPRDAPGGGQYATITVTSAKATNEGDNSAVLEKTAIAHTIFAEITGSTVHAGEITDANVPSFMTVGNIFGESTIKNTGNVHGKATYTLIVTPVFSSEEAYTNAENPTTHDVLPGRSYYNKIEWDKTPAAGLFNVKYIVNFDGVVTEVSKMVVICPVWMMILAIVIAVAIVVAIVCAVKRRKDN